MTAVYFRGRRSKEHRLSQATACRHLMSAAEFKMIKIKIVFVRKNELYRENLVRKQIKNAKNEIYGKRTA